MKMTNEQTITKTWYSIKDGPPPADVPLIVTVKDNLLKKRNKLRYPVYCEKDDDGKSYHWYWWFGNLRCELMPEIDEVIAWMPLPKPYKEE